ncbi:MAG: diacylglycerol kinase family lipid kinase [Bacteroidales bacterium]|nr:diacylglycerol kinase family lipid kinase [Bacteroidales bacterium]
MAKEKICFIINPISGTRKKDAWPEIIHRIIDASRFDIRIFFTEQAGHASELAGRQIDEGVPYIVAVGGDGTVNEVAMSVRDTQAAMGIVPCGSGNGLARHLHIPMKLTEALKLINNASVISIDYGVVNSRPFFCTFGAGFDARISHAFATNGKRGFMTYVSIIAREFISYRSRKYKLKIDGNKFKTKAMMVTIANSAQYGNNGYISPYADITDGELDVCILRPFPKFRAVRLAFRLLHKSIHKSPYYSMIKGKKIVLTQKCEENVHLDGEPHTMGKKLKIKIVPQGLKVLVQKDGKIG